MLEQLSLEHFKCFQLLQLPLRPLTLLTGANASGKSTVLQALVLLHQTMLEHEWATRLQLNGSELALGTVADVVDKVEGRRSFAIAVSDSDHSIRWEFDYGDGQLDMSVAVSKLALDGRDVPPPATMRMLIPASSHPNHERLVANLQRLTYITAERSGPRDGYRLQDPSATQLVGPQGENAVGILHLKSDAPVAPKLAIGSEPPTLLRQVEARMRAFFPGVSLAVHPVPQMSYVTLGLRTSDATGFHRPVNVGFGITQVLPIVVAALAAKEGDLLLIENPEVHLHPSGQASMGRFLAEVASSGVQVVAETHSDHVLNGIRRAVKGGVVAPDDTLLHFFRSRDSGEDQVAALVLDSSGNLDWWPAGFFDQLDKDMNYFAGWGD